METEDKLAFIDARKVNMKQVIKALKQELQFILAEKEELNNPPDKHKCI
jgi:hypothetical protein